MAIDFKPLQVGDFVQGTIKYVDSYIGLIGVEVEGFGIFELGEDSILPGMWNTSDNVGKTIILEVVSLRPLKFAQYGLLPLDGKANLVLK